MKLHAASVILLAVGLAGCGGGGSTGPASVKVTPVTDSTPTTQTDIGTAPITVTDPAPGVPVVPPPPSQPATSTPIETPAPPPALSDAAQSGFDPGSFDTPVAAPEDPTVAPPPGASSDPTAGDYFSALAGGGEVPSAARGTTNNNSPYVSATADAYPTRATVGLFGVERVSGSGILGNVQFNDPSVALATVPSDFTSTGFNFVNRLVFQEGSGVTLESRVITYFRSGYRNDVDHERAWWAALGGEARVNGVDGYTFSIYVEDRRNPSDPNDTRTGLDFFSITIHAPEVPYGGMVNRDGVAIWGLGGVVYHNQYVLSVGDIQAVNTPPEPVGTQP